VAKKSKEPIERKVSKKQLSHWEQEQRRSRIITISISSVIIAVLILVSIVIIDSLSDDDNVTVLKVGDRSFDMDYYAKMLNLYGIRNSSSEDDVNEKAQEVLQAIEDREIMRQLATDLGVSVDGDEIDEKIDEAFPAPEPDEDGNLPAYSDYEILIKRLDKIGVSEKDVRQDFEAAILSVKVQEFIGERDVPGELPQAHVRGIMADTKIEAPQQSVEDVEVVVEGNPDAQVDAQIEPEVSIQTATIQEEKVNIQMIVAQIKARLDDGEDFASLAEEFSTDGASSRSGGDLDWIPEGISETASGARYSEEFEATAFNLDIGTLSEPIPLNDSANNTRFWLIDPIERQDSRELDEGERNVFEYKAFNDWYPEQRDTFVIEDLLDDVLRKQAIAEALQ